MIRMIRNTQLEKSKNKIKELKRKNKKLKEEIKQLEIDKKELNVLIDEFAQELRLNRRFGKD